MKAILVDIWWHHPRRYCSWQANYGYSHGWEALTTRVEWEISPGDWTNVRSVSLSILSIYSVLLNRTWYFCSHIIWQVFHQPRDKDDKLGWPKADKHCCPSFWRPRQVSLISILLHAICFRILLQIKYIVCWNKMSYIIKNFQHFKSSWLWRFIQDVQHRKEVASKWVRSVLSLYDWIFFILYQAIWNWCLEHGKKHRPAWGMIVALIEFIHISPDIIFFLSEFQHTNTVPNYSFWTQGWGEKNKGRHQRVWPNLGFSNFCFCLWFSCTPPSGWSWSIIDSSLSTRSS